ncbi:MerR family transcriptional regulator [Acidocella sp.]|uniref:MerR family transcriptional regulator n=1 Tax=Acidocella sp. TaxID=50710 RepID=UPI003D037DC0
MVDEEYNPELEDGAPADLNGEAGRPRIRKAADAFRTISEVADELHVPQHVLRFWETKFPQVRPLKRGGGRRYYRPEDVLLLRRVADLLYTQGYTIKGVQRLLRDNAVSHSEPPVQAVAQDSLLPPEAPKSLSDSDIKTEPAPETSSEPAEPDFGVPPEIPPAAELEVAPSPEPEAPPEEESEAVHLRALLTEALSTLEELRRALG